jgi:hypothetical protein
VVNYHYLLGDLASVTHPYNDEPGTTSDGHLKLNVGILGPGIDVYMTATMTTASPPYTTVWSSPVLIDKPKPCPSAQFVGVRGSGETRIDAGGYGKTVADLKSRLQSVVPNLADVPIDYPAIKVDLSDLRYTVNYINSVAAGKDALRNYIDAITFGCPMTPMVVVGYSQGAHVAGDVYEELPYVTRRHVVALVLFGDPRFNPGQPEVDAGDYDRSDSGSFTLLGGPRLISQDSAARVQSFCTHGDPVCNLSIANLYACRDHSPDCPHFDYVSRGWTEIASQWTRQALLSTPSLP